MSLSSLLLGQGAKAADADLDALFTRTKVEAPVQVSKPKPAAAAVAAAGAASVVGAKASTSKAKIAPPEEIIKQAKIAKARAAGSRPSNKETADSASAAAAKNASRKDRNKSVTAATDADSSSAVVAGSKQKQIEGPELSKKRRRDSTAADASLIHESLLNASVDGSDDDEDEDEDDDGMPLMHESLLLGLDGTSKYSAGLQPRARKQAKHMNESKSDRDARTTFIGNVPIACATNKSSKKALVRHLISTLPAEYQAVTKLESIRFRSLQLATPAFTDDGRDNPAAAPSKDNNDDDDEEEDEGAAKADNPDNHARKRARRWKGGEVVIPASSTNKPLKFLTANQKKKIGAIKGQVHEKASTCIAYAVWDTIQTPSTTTATASTSSTKGALHTPQEIASLIIKYGNNTTFENFTLRVDHVKGSFATLPEGQAAEDAETKSKRELALEQKGRQEEEKRTLYVGSLDFEEKEQAIRDLCEKLMVEERGEPQLDDEEKKSGAKIVPSWVERVRLVRDAETGLGKGFAYVMFKDRECVDEMLALDATRVKLSKRKLRLERCKTAAAKAAIAIKAAREAAHVERKEKQTAARRSSAFDASKLPAVPKVARAPRPDIGDQLKTLSKEERKALKTSDDDRLARRLEKKQGKREAIKIEKQKEFLDRKVKSAGGSSYKARVDPAKEGLKRNKRMRSDNTVFAKNRKKTVA